MSFLEKNEVLSSLHQPQPALARSSFGSCTSAKVQNRAAVPYCSESEKEKSFAKMVAWSAEVIELLAKPGIIS